APPPDYNIFKDELVRALGLMPEIERAFAGDHVVLAPFWYDASKLEHVRVEGRRVAIELTMTPLRDRSGTVRHVGLCYKAVTAELELHAERRALRLLFELAPEAIVLFDLDTGLINDANDNAVRLFGYPRERLIGMGPDLLSAERQSDGRLSSEAIL